MLERRLSNNCSAWSGVQLGKPQRVPGGVRTQVPLGANWNQGRSPKEAAQLIRSRNSQLLVQGEGGVSWIFLEVGIFLEE